MTGVTDPTERIRTLTALYRQAFREVVTVGLAMDPSEVRLLEAVDIPVVVQSDSVDAARLLRKVPTARFIDGCSPCAWGEAIWDLVNARSSFKEVDGMTRQREIRRHDVMMTSTTK